MLSELKQRFEILLVEDESADAHLIRAALTESKLPCSVSHVMDGVDALAFLRRDGNLYSDAPQPDLILLDLNMPRMDGREFLAQAKADPELAATPVVIFSTSNLEHEVQACYRLGAAGYITKPADMMRFNESILQLGKYWFGLVRLPKRDRT